MAVRQALPLINIMHTITFVAHPSEPPLPAEGKQQYLLEPDPYQRPVLERLGIERHSAAFVGTSDGTTTLGRSTTRILYCCTLFSVHVRTATWWLIETGIFVSKD